MEKFQKHWTKLKLSNLEQGLPVAALYTGTIAPPASSSICSLCWLPALIQVGEANGSEFLLSFSQIGLRAVSVIIWEFPKPVVNALKGELVW